MITISSLAAAHATVSTTLALGPQWLDPTYLLGSDGPFGAFVLPGMLLIIFIETGLLFPLLPGDSLLFTAGFLSIQPNGFAPIWLVCLSAWIVAVLGDQCAYWIGRKGGSVLRQRKDNAVFKKEHLVQAHLFFEKYGAVTVIICRFVPIVRTYAPVVAGMSGFRYRVFLPFDILGGLLWGCGVTLLGAALGNFSFVQNNIELLFLLVIFLSLLPAIFTAIKGVVDARKSDLPESIDPEDAADHILAGTPDEKNADVRKRLVAAFQTEQNHEGREAAAIKEQVCSEILDFSRKEDAKAYA